MIIKNGQILALDTVEIDSNTLSGTGRPGDPLTVVGGAGERGPKGDPGVGIQKVETKPTPENDGVDIQFVLTDGSKSEVFTVYDGPEGKQGQQGPKGATGATGPKGDKGDKGATGATGPTGPKGDKGDKGATGATGAAAGFGTPTATATALDPNTIPTVEVSATGDNTAKVFDFKFGIPKGEKGDTGEKGETGTQGQQGVGISNIDKTSTSGLVDTYTITYSDASTSTFTVTNGDKGADGASVTNASINSNGSLIITIGTEAHNVGTVVGNDGRGISKIETQHNDTAKNTKITITYTDSQTPVEFTIPDGVKGADGKSAYEVAKETGYSGSESEWIASLKGEQGEPGKDGTGVTILGSYDTVEELITAHPTGKIGDAYLVAGNLYVWDNENTTWKNVGNIQGPAGEDGNDGTNGKSVTSVRIDKGDLYVAIDGKESNIGHVAGTDGSNGVGISKIEKTGTTELVDTYTITYTNNTTSTFTVTNGKNGTDGKSIDSVSLSANGHLHVTIDGDDNDVGLVKGENGNGISKIEKTGTTELVDTYTITYTNNTTSTFTVTNGKNGTNGTDGTNGKDGVDGNGISKIEKTDTTGLVDTYTITYTKESPSTFTVTNGKDGTNGTDGTNGIDGKDGADGVDGNGISKIEKTDTTGLVDTYTITYTDSTSSTFTVTNGKDGTNGTDGTNGIDGKDGADGVDGNGISKIEKTDTTGLVDTYTITYTSGSPTTFTVTNGKDGTNGTDGTNGIDGKDGVDGNDGTDGTDGFSPYVTVTSIGAAEGHTNGGTKIDITYQDSEKKTQIASYSAWNGNDGEVQATYLPGDKPEAGFYGLSATESTTSWQEIPTDYVTSAGLTTDVPYVFMNNQWEPAYNQIVAVYKSGDNTFEGYANKVSYYYHSNTTRTDYNYIGIDSPDGTLKMWTLPQHWSTMVSGDNYISVSAGKNATNDWRWFFSLNTTALDNVYQKQSAMSNYVTSADITTADTQYAMTTGGWKPVQGGSGGKTYTGGDNIEVNNSDNTISVSGTGTVIAGAGIKIDEGTDSITISTSGVMLATDGITKISTGTGSEEGVLYLLTE